MQSLEVAILLGFSLLVVFAAVPFIWQNVSVSMAQLEARQYMAFLVSVADALSADFGMVGVKRSFYLPNLAYGSFSVRRYPMEIECGGRRVSAYPLFIWYNSSYIIGGERPLRGERNITVALLGQPLAAVNASSLGLRDGVARGYVLFTGPVLVSGGNKSVLYVLSVREINFKGVSLSYRVISVRTSEDDDSLRLTSPDGICIIRMWGREWKVRLGREIHIVVTEIVIE